MPRKFRIAASLLLALAMAPGTWVRVPAPLRSESQELRMEPVAPPSAAEQAANLGPFRLEGIWRLQGDHHRFGGYSALVRLENRRLFAISDRGFSLTFTEPGTPPGFPRKPAQILRVERGAQLERMVLDIEAASRDPESGRVWLAMENSNVIRRHGPDFAIEGLVAPKQMRDWGDNGGPEAMVRLRDGRFIVLREGFDSLFDRQRHRALLFAVDPVAGAPASEFTFSSPDGFSPTDMAELPDGRVLILMRKLVWPLPVRTAGRIVLADPATIRPGQVWRGRIIARLTSSLPVDNFEALTIEPQEDGPLLVWILSDDNSAVTQRTLLWKLSIDPADL